MRFLPEGWQSHAVKLGALLRKRKVKSAETLLRVLLIHFASGKSLRTTIAYAREAGICDINDVALLNRLRDSKEWLRWISFELLKELKASPFPEQLLKKFRVRLVDGSSISGPGSKGTDWRIHYCFLLNSFQCDTFKITDPKVGEKLELYPVRQGDLIIGDRGYCKRKGITYVLQKQGHVLIRFHSNNLPLYKRNKTKFPVLEHLKSLEQTEVGDWDVWFISPDDNKMIKGRICALRKSEHAIEIAKNKLIKTAKKKGRKLRPETLEYAEYIVLFTTVNRHKFQGSEMLSLYRERWQIELVFKRLKSILGIGKLPKRHSESCKAWLHGKMLVALLVERLYQEAEFFSPWGYPKFAPTQ